MIARSDVSDMTRPGEGRSDKALGTNPNEEFGKTPDLLLDDLTQWARTAVNATSSHTIGERSGGDNESEFEEEDPDDEEQISRPSDEVIYSGSEGEDDTLNLVGHRPGTSSLARGKNSLLRASTDPSGLSGKEHPGDRAGRRRSLGLDADSSSFRRSDREDKQYPRAMSRATSMVNTVSPQTRSSGRMVSFKGLFTKNKAGKLTKLPDGSEATAESSEATEFQTSSNPLRTQRSIRKLLGLGTNKADDA